MAFTVLTLSTLDTDILTIECFAFPSPPHSSSTQRRSPPRSEATMTGGISRHGPQLPVFSFPQSFSDAGNVDDQSEKPLNQSTTLTSTQHMRNSAISRSTSKRHAQIFSAIPPVPKHLLDAQLPLKSRPSDPSQRRRPSPLKFELADRSEYPPDDNLAESPALSDPVTSQQPTRSLTRRPARPDLRRGISGDSAITSSSAAISACPMLIHDDNLAAEPQAPRSFHDAEDDISEAESDDITKDYETFRAITARKLYGTATPELDDEDDDDDEDFWCKGLNNAMPTKMHDTQVTPKGRDDIIEEWIRDCTANLSVR